MSKKNNFPTPIISVFSAAFLLFSGLPASSMEIDEADFQRTRQYFPVNKQETEEERLERLFNENRDAMEQAKKRVKKRLKIDPPRKPYNKK
jgi:hypothetical protein